MHCSPCTSFSPDFYEALHGQLCLICNFSNTAEARKPSFSKHFVDMGHVLQCLFRPLICDTGRMDGVRNCGLVCTNASVEKRGWGPLDDLFELGLDIQPRNLAGPSPEPRAWYGPDGQLVRVLPCPSCGGRGYILCPQCNVASPDALCQECLGKGLRTCSKCIGERVVWENSLDEMPWENAQSCSPLQVTDDEIVDSMDIQLAPERRSTRVYRSPSDAVREKIRQALKKLNAQTGSISKRMKRIISDPIINAKRIAAIKKAKSTEAARRNISEKRRLYFQNPENRLKQSLLLKGREFTCRLCGEKGHRRHYCPTLQKGTRRSYRCSLCGQLGHSMTTCHSDSNGKPERTKREFTCSLCGGKGHRKHYCPTLSKALMKKGTPRSYHCSLCGQPGHSRITCQGGSNMKTKRVVKVLEGNV